jgi:single-strand DNA-binding protein
MLNKTMFLGNLGKDPEEYKTESTTIAKFSVGVNEKLKGEIKTQWFNCISFGKQAEFVLRNCKKGTAVYVEGAMRSETYNEKLRWTLYTTQILPYSNKVQNEN